MFNMESGGFRFPSWKTYVTWALHLNPSSEGCLQVESPPGSEDRRASVLSMTSCWFLLCISPWVCALTSLGNPHGTHSAWPLGGAQWMLLNKWINECWETIRNKSPMSSVAKLECLEVNNMQLCFLHWKTDDFMKEMWEIRICWNKKGESTW